MAKKLPWFKFYALDWLTDPRVQALTNEQRGIFHWLLCRQWIDGDLPSDLLRVYPLLPPGSDSVAVAYILTEFFPADPDTTRRQNHRLTDIRAEQESKYAAKLAAAQRARGGKPKSPNGLQRVRANVSSKGRIRIQNQKIETTDNQSSEEPVDLATHCVVLVNRSYPQTGLEGYRNPLTASKARSVVEGWVGDGIPENVILGALQGVCGRIPTGTRVSSMRYFDQAVRKAHLAPKVDPMDEVIRTMQAQHDRGEL